MTDTHGGGTDTVTYAYDNRDRLTTETHPAGDTISYVFDDAGNKVSMTTSGGSTATESYTYDDLNRMTNDSVDGGDSTDYHYDDQGNQVYVSGLGQIAWDTNNPSGYAQEIEESHSRNFFTGLAVLAQWINSSGGANYLLADGHGSTRYVTDSSGGVQNEILYDSFGNTLTTQPGSIYATKVLFTGQWFRSASGMYDLRARMYDPNVGRFTTQDSLRFGAGDLGNSNLYLFVRDNPGNRWDPSGHSEFNLPSIQTVALGVTLIAGGLATFLLLHAGYSISANGMYAGQGFSRALRNDIDSTLAALPSPIWDAGRAKATSAMEIIEHYAPAIRKFSEQQGIPPAITASVLLTELRHYNLKDLATDGRMDASIGIAQIRPDTIFKHAQMAPDLYPPNMTMDKAYNLLRDPTSAIDLLTRDLSYAARYGNEKVNFNTWWTRDETWRQHLIRGFVSAKDLEYFYDSTPYGQIWGMESYSIIKQSGLFNTMQGQDDVISF